MQKYVCVCFVSIRILPHKQDTGGFFVAVMEKRSTLKEATKRDTPPKNSE